MLRTQLYVTVGIVIVVYFELSYGPTRAYSIFLYLNSLVYNVLTIFKEKIGGERKKLMVWGIKDQKKDIKRS